MVFDRIIIKITGKELNIINSSIRYACYHSLDEAIIFSSGTFGVPYCPMLG
jgi:hypothetical protein